MKKILKLSAILLMMFCFTKIAAQKKHIIATVKNSITRENLTAVSVLVKQGTGGTSSDENGKIAIAFSGQYPVTLILSSVGYEPKEITLEKDPGHLQIDLNPSFSFGDVFVVSAQRKASSSLRTPVTVERINSADIVNSGTPDFFEGISKIKGVDVTTSGLFFRTVSTRGFNGSGNLRLNQFLDGMDNQAPGLNFSVGNLLGMSELDVDNIELLPGASSALYGSGGLTGTLLMTSKSPFEHQGLSLQVKEGIMHVDGKQRNASPYHDFSIRLAKAFKNKFAFKINAQFVKAQDWQAQDKSNLERTDAISKSTSGDRTDDPNYDGVNVYGDELNVDMFTTSFGIIQQVTQAYVIAYRQQTGSDPTPEQIDEYLSNDPTYKYIYLAFKNKLIPHKNVSRTGYDEKDLVDYDTYNLKLSGGLYYKLSTKTELSLVGYWGTGTTVYTGMDRYSLKDVKMGQYKVELKNKNWLLRAFTTQENAGGAYNTTALASYINESWKPSQKWFPEYLSYYSAMRLNSQPDAAAHQFARSKSDSGRYSPGTPAFQAAFDRISQTPIVDKGALFLDKSDLYQVEGQVNLSDKIKFMDVLVGANYKQYVLNSEGTLFADTAGRIKIPEWGSFVELQKSLFKDLLTFTASGRYDKSKNYKAQFTPRVTALVKIATKNYLRLSYQSAFRFPITQDQYINLFTGTSTLIGALPEFGELYQFKENPAYTSQSISQFRQTRNASDLKIAPFENLNPEKVKTFELGYKSLIAEKLFIDLYVYNSQFSNIIGRVSAGQPKSPATYTDDLLSSFTTKSFTYAQNLKQNVRTRGYGIGVGYRFAKTYTFNANASSDKMYDVPADFITFFNTPAFRYNIGLSNAEAWKGFGFDVNYRWQEKVNWEGTFASGVIPSYGTVNAQVSYKVKKMKTLIKLGASNLFNKYYQSAFGNPQIGGVYYVSLGYNVFK